MSLLGYLHVSDGLLDVVVVATLPRGGRVNVRHDVPRLCKLVLDLRLRVPVFESTLVLDIIVLRL